MHVFRLGFLTIGWFTTVWSKPNSKNHVYSCYRAHTHTSLMWIDRQLRRSSKLATQKYNCKYNVKHLCQIAETKSKYTDNSSWLGFLWHHTFTSSVALTTLYVMYFCVWYSFLFETCTFFFSNLISCKEYPVNSYTLCAMRFFFATCCKINVVNFDILHH